jgi:general secretion pathway protein G
MTRACTENWHPHHRAVRTERTHRGFSLIEVIVAVTIIALLAALVAPRFASLLRSSKRRTAQIEANALHRQVELYMIERGGGSISTDFELLELTQGEDPYLNNRDDLIDPWGTEYDINVPGDYNVDFDIVSYGLDGMQGGEGDDEDLISNQDN